MTYLDIDLWPTGWVLAVTGALVLALRALDRYASRYAAARTRDAVQRALTEAPEPGAD